MRIMIISRNFPVGGHKGDFYHSSSKSENGVVYFCFRSMAEQSGNFVKVPILQFCLFKVYPLFFQLEKSLDGFSRTWIMRKQSICVLKCVNS